MAYDDRSLDDYVDVAQRIADFRERHPDGTLQPLDPATPYQVERIPNQWCRECIGRRVIKAGRDSWKQCSRCSGSGLRGEGEPAEDLFIVYTAAAYRTKDDPRPGIGVAWEPFPGQTPYTKQSEVMNAETSAQGRAIVAALASDSKRGVASREEVRNRAAERDDSPPAAVAGNGRAARPPRQAPGADMQDEIRSEERPGFADPADLSAIHRIYYTKLGFDERTDALHVAQTSEQLLSRPHHPGPHRGSPLSHGPNRGKTHKNLTWHEAKDLRAALERFKGDRAKLLAQLAGITQDTAAEDPQEVPS